MALRIEKNPAPTKRSLYQGETYSASSGTLQVGVIMEILDRSIVDRVWTERTKCWAWGVSVSISTQGGLNAPAAAGKAATLELAIEKLDEAWDQWVPYLGLAKTGTDD